MSVCLRWFVAPGLDKFIQKVKASQILLCVPYYLNKASALPRLLLTVLLPTSDKIVSPLITLLAENEVLG
jgi:hypothetical protein